MVLIDIHPRIKRSKGKRCIWITHGGNNFRTQKTTEWNPSISHLTKILSVRKLRYNRRFRQSVAAWRKIGRTFSACGIFSWKYYGVKALQVHNVPNNHHIRVNYIVFYEIWNFLHFCICWCSYFLLNVWFFLHLGTIIGILRERF